ncbi:hypothetical protein OKW21_006398 [Catalinimonas alkaloidigena]|uniref:retropepsin-like aspartic protease n=1 Tax=Catalinimonas alkaloidigena TaxID=1075417 RepID=UPI002406471B|nr:retropepsin-like aspartic protease [Catalinimonas alkaloidigena]MDF9801135.1 hypothetical protein [Catalinimonas alkaloidigena]
MKRFFALMLLSALCSAQMTFAQVSPIKIKKLNSKPIVEAKLNGKKAYFLLDTGSDITVLHDENAKHFDFKIKRMVSPQRVAGIHGNVNNMNRAYGLKLELGDLPIKIPFFTYDLSSVIQAIHSSTLLRISGIIGSDVMIKYGFIIDYKEELVHMESPTMATVAQADVDQTNYR